MIWFHSDMIEIEAGEDEIESNIFAELTPLKRKEMFSEKEAAKRPKSSELGDKNDDAVVYLDSVNPEGKSVAELKKILDCSFKAFESFLAMNVEQLQEQRELVKQETFRREEMERKCVELTEKLQAHEKRLEQLQAEGDYLYERGFKDVCSKLLASEDFGMKMCNAVHAEVECVLSKNSEASFDALMKTFELLQSPEYNLLGMSFEFRGFSI